MPNMAAIISRHNKIVLSNKTTANSTPPPCNCRNKVSCPLEGKCCKSFIVYKACLISGNAANNYYGCCETEFKARFNNHNQSFKYRRKSNATELSKAFWQAKDAAKKTAKNGVLWPIEPHTIRGQGLAIYASKKNLQSCRQIQAQPSTKERNSTENVVI